MLSDTITLVDNSTGTPANVSLIRVAQASSPNNTSLRRQTPYDPANAMSLTLSFNVNAATGILVASYSTRLDVSSGSLQEYGALTTRFTVPSKPGVLTKAQILRLMSAHGSFIDTAGALTDADNAVRALYAGEI